jgi:2-C-methyl-D-erythritol 4-phosphate cytidylyltransferase
MLEKNYLIIPAGGRGIRMGSSIPKQFLDWEGKPILQSTILAFLGPEMPTFEAIIVAVPAEYISLVKSWSPPITFKVVEGGLTRFESVSNCLDQIPAEHNPTVLIHDGVRPFPPAREIKKALEIIQPHEVMILAEPIFDTVKRVNSQSLVSHTEDRTTLYRAQTPQIAKRSIWIEAFEFAKIHHADITDDSLAAEKAGIPVRVMSSPASNRKMTTPADLM